MVNIGELSSISVNRPCSTPTHLLYGDDILLFCQCTSKNIRNIVRFLSFYGGLSSQIVNMNKSFMYFGKFVSNVRRWKLSFDASMKISQLHFIYLGVYLFQGAPKACFLRSVADFILSFFFYSWKDCSLFYAKMVRLVNSIITCKFVHTFNVYQWPVSLLNSFNKTTRNFVWSSSILRKKVINVAWDNCCMPRLYGGLGLKNLVLFKCALLSKVTWRVMSDFSFVYHFEISFPRLVYRILKYNVNLQDWDRLI